MRAFRCVRVAAILVAATVPACLAGADDAELDDAEWTDARAVLMADGTPGDPDYGAYLVQECSACHIADGAGSVPPIAGIEPGYFREAMAEYANGLRENAAMASVANSLDGDQLAALAAYFAAHQSQED